MDELTKGEKKMFLPGLISHSLNCSSTTECSKRSTQKQRTRSRTVYRVEGKHLCRNGFMFMHRISNNYLNLLTKHYKSNGVCLPKPKTGGRRFNKTALSTEDITRIVTFITSYGELHGLPLPGRQSRVNTNDPRTRLLPSSKNKSTVFRKYEKEMEEVNRRKTAAGK
ncbi:uncharacterized protein LOC117107603 [Anneissia japonica]|uniref:uncharacterized protein LOC117107603 n=1 Tax=Anneissia japonica TaxID=1529436 RepID=UPI0014258FB2|nr:uncharacterized protein LOC117107603 [Anneissia japonica]